MARLRPQGRSAVVLLSAALLLAACSGGGSSAAPSEAEASEEPAASAAPSAAGSPEIGVTDSEITIGMAYPLSGPAAPYGELFLGGFSAYIEYVNANGGVQGRTIEMVVKDHQGTPDIALSVTRELVEDDQVFAVLNMAGTGAANATYEYLRDEGVPQMFITSGVPYFNDPEGFPGLFTYSLAYDVDATSMLEFVNAEYPDASIGILYQNDDFGQAYLDAFEAEVSDRIVAAETYNTTDTDISSQLTNLKNAGAEVLIDAGIGAFVVQAIEFVNNNNWDVVHILNSQVTDPAVLTAGVSDVALLEGIRGGTLTPLLTDEDNEQVQFFVETMEEFSPDVELAQSAMYSFGAAQLFVELLDRAGANPTRQGIIDAAQAIEDFTEIALVGPVTMSPTDHAALRCEQFIVFDATGTPAYDGDVICAPARE